MSRKYEKELRKGKENHKNEALLFQHAKANTLHHCPAVESLKIPSSLFLVKGDQRGFVSEFNFLKVFCDGIIVEVREAEDLPG